MRETEIRTALIHALRQRDGTAAIIEELPIWRGRGRADVAFVNGELCGYEIKSERDTLRRLGDQVQLYDSIFEFAAVVVAPVHVKGVRKLIPNRWGIFVAQPLHGLATIRQLRAARRNSAADAQAVARILRKRECVRVLAKNGILVGSATPIRRLWDQVAELPMGRLLHEVRDALKAREVGSRPSQDDDSCTTGATASSFPAPLLG